MECEERLKQAARKSSVGNTGQTETLLVSQASRWTVGNTQVLKWSLLSERKEVPWDHASRWPSWHTRPADSAEVRAVQSLCTWNAAPGTEKAEGTGGRLVSYIIRWQVAWRELGGLVWKRTMRMGGCSLGCLCQTNLKSEIWWFFLLFVFIVSNKEE